MARISGRNCYAAASSLASGSINLSGRSNTFTLNITSEEVDVTSFGAAYRERVADALKDWGVEVSGFWDGAASNLDAFLNEILAACCVIVVGPGGSATSSIKYSGCAILQDYSIEGAVEGAVTYSATFQAASVLNRATF